MAITVEQVGKLHASLSEELQAEVDRNPELDREVIRGWIHEQLRHFEREGWQGLPQVPPIEPKANAGQQDEMDALDQIWRRAIATMRQHTES
jgi:hypothetical protein